MSHATVLVISKKNDKITIDKMMYPYWELDLKFDDLMKDPRAVFEPEYTIEEAKKEHRKISKKYPKDHYEEMSLDKFMRKWSGYILKEGSYGYYHNPNDKWDWYEIGGRYAGRIKLKDGKTGKKGRKSFMIEEDPYKNGNVDSAQIKDIDPEWLKNVTSFAVLNKDGWHEKSELGWFGCSHYDKYCCIAEELELKEILKEFKYDYFGFSKNWKGYTNEYTEQFIRTLHKHYERKGKKYVLKNNQGHGKVEVTEDLKQIEFFRDKHWSKNFYNRFIKNLDPEMYLTYVDYHI